MKKLLFAMFAALLLAGCSDSNEVEGVRKSDELLGGQIFIVTKGRENIKLGLVTVKVFDEDSIIRIRAEANAILEERLVSVDEDSNWDDFLGSCIDSVIAQVSPIAETKSDADGRFLFTPPSDKFVLAATCSRLTADEEEKYRWLEIFQRDSIGPSGLLLSNDNLLGVIEDSVVSTSNAKSSFLEIVSDAKMRERQRIRAADERRRAADERRQAELEVWLAEREARRAAAPPAASPFVAPSRSYRTPARGHVPPSGQRPHVPPSDRGFFAPR